MNKLGVRLLIMFLAALPFILHAQVQPEGKEVESKKNEADILARQSTVFEQFHTTVTFEQDGRWEEEEYCRARVESEGGVNQMGRLVFGYAAENQHIDVTMVRVLKKDGTVVEAGPDSILDVPRPFAGIGNEYTDYCQKHVQIPNLRPGDVVEYRIKRIEDRPFARGHFWFAHSFHRYQTCVEEKLTVSVPSGVEIKLRYKPKHQPALTDESGRRTYEWKSSHLPEDESKTKDKKRDLKSRKEMEEEAQPDVQLTTFANWEHLGAWYRPLQESRMKVTDAVRDKTGELVRDCKTDLEKIQAIYSFVATGVRYVSLSFGLGRYVPHPAEQVLEYRYGDCKDKHTLLATMLRIAGFQACPVLTNAYRKVTEDQPSPIQFNHVLTVVHLPGREIWLDTTSETAPFQVLSSSLRNKRALVVHLEGPSILTRIPGTPPFPFFEETNVEAALSETGLLTGKVSHKVRGAEEIQWRQSFRSRPASDWKTGAEGSHRNLGLPGEVTNVIAVSDPLKTEGAFEVSYEFSGLVQINRDSSTQSRVALPLPQLGMPWAFVDDRPDPEPIDLGYPIRRTARLRLQLPSGLVERAPLPVSAKRDYAEYRSIYKLDGDVLTAERCLEIKAPEIDGKRGAENSSFSQAVATDTQQSLSPREDFLARRLKAEKEDADELHANAMSALESRDYSTAMALFKRVVALEPDHKYAWNNLGRCHLGLGQLETAIEAFRKQIAINPYDQYSYNNLGRAYFRLDRFVEAEEAYRKQLEINPLDEYAHRNLADLFYQQEGYEKALPELENALTIKPEDVYLQLQLGATLFHLGRPDEGYRAFSKVLEKGQSPPFWNNIAYAMAKFHFKMDLAEQYAKAAVEGIRTVLLDAPVTGKFCCPQLPDALAAYWDTLGFVAMQKGEWERAEKYIRAGWELGQHGECGLHLAQMHLHAGNREAAISQLVLSLSAWRPPKEVREKLIAMVGLEKIERLTQEAAQELVDQRTVRVSPARKEDLSADFSLILSSDRPSEVRFIEGDEKLRDYEEHLRNTRFPFRAPDAQPVRLLRRGKLSCSARTGECKFVLYLPRDVHAFEASADQEPKPTQLSNR